MLYVSTTADCRTTADWPQTCRKISSTLMSYLSTYATEAASLKLNHSESQHFPYWSLRRMIVSLRTESFIFCASCAQISMYTDRYSVWHTFHSSADDRYPHHLAKLSSFMYRFAALSNEIVARKLHSFFHTASKKSTSTPLPSANVLFFAYSLSDFIAWSIWSRKRCFGGAFCLMEGLGEDHGWDGSSWILGSVWQRRQEKKCRRAVPQRRFS